MAIDLFSIGKFTIHGYGLMIGLGFLAAVLIGCYRAKLQGLSSDLFSSMAIYVLIFGFLGGKLLFIIVEFKKFLENPLGALGSSGFVVYGGIITGLLAIYFFCKIKKVSVASYADLIAPSIAINQGFGRIGCFMAGCCYGKETDSPIGVIFPEGCLAPAGIKLIPTQLISAIGMLLVGVLLILIARKTKYKGVITGLYLLMYSIGRFIIEFFRNDYRGTVGFLSTSQFISIFILVLSIVILVLSYKKKVPVCADNLDGATDEAREEAKEEAGAETIEENIEENNIEENNIEETGRSDE